MRTFSEGDKVAYPMNGAGVIEAIEEKNVMGKLHKYYVLNIPVGNLKLMLPIERAGEIGVRAIVSEAEADRVLGEYWKTEDYEESVWTQRYRENMEKLRSGSFLDVAQVTRALVLRDKKKPLSSIERKMLSQAKHILVSELMLIKNQSAEEIETMLFGEAR